MTKQQIFKLLYLVKAAFAKYYMTFSEKDFENLAEVWGMCFEGYSFEDVAEGLKAYLTTDTSGFPPTPAQIIDKIQKIKPQAQELNGNEAWALVYRAIRNSAYNADKEFDKLPPMIQKSVGSADNLKAWATDASFNEGVEQSHFIKVYNATVEREKEIAKLPPSTRARIASVLQERARITG